MSLVYHGSMIPVNPLKAQREKIGLTQDEVAMRTGVTRHFITKLEQGLLNVPSHDVLVILYGLEDDLAKRIDAYHDWQRVVRKKNGLLVKNALRSGGFKSWRELREFINESRIGFCKQFCIHPQVLETFEGKPRTRFTPYMHQVWLDAGLTEVQITEWEETWR